MASKNFPPSPMPKVKTAGKVSTRGPAGTKGKGDTLSRDDRYTQNKQSSVTIRSRSSVNTIIQNLAQLDGIFSAALNAAVTLSVNKGFKVAGYDSNGVMDLGIMAAAYSLLDRLDGPDNYDAYSDKLSIREVINTLTIGVVTSGGCGLELVLDKTGFPTKLVPIDYASITWELADDEGSRYPTQKDNDNDLNIPTVFFAEHMRHPNNAYAVSMLRPGIEMTFMYSEFIEDMRRTLRQTGNPRILAKLAVDKVTASMPAAVKNDPKLVKSWMEDAYAEVAKALTGMEPEDAAVFWDSVDITIAESTGEKADYATLLKTYANMYGTSLKSPASALGLRVEGGQGLSNSETLIYMKEVGAIPYTVCSILSRALTLGIRLMGFDGSVKITPNPVELRPEAELEAYRSTEQNRVLKLLSLGLINDAQACYELNIRPNMLVESLAGTRFDDKNTDSSTPSADRTTSSGASLNPGTPEKSGGEDQ